LNQFYLMFTFLAYDRSRAFYHMLNFMAYSVLNAIAKLAYHCPRPYMIDADLEVYGHCSQGFGHPSGHSHGSCTVLLVLALDWIAYKKVKGEWKFLYIGAALTGTFMIGFSRLYNGVHSLEQIFYGWQCGIFQALFFHYEIRDRILSNTSDLL